ncbi:MAG: hypothetical protein NTZ74_00445 [Chloroflexi bacterium]|nr:hypothetical protein [Chloroflexota bacterium]
MSDFLTRDELLSGLVGRRAQTLLFVIENRTAWFLERSRRRMERFLPEEVLLDREVQYLEALSRKEPPPLRPTIQDIERFADQWSILVSDQPRVRAALAFLLKKKYAFSKEAIPGIRAALFLDSPEVQNAYLPLYHEQLSSIYQGQVSLLERLRWFWTRISKGLENLPPFWGVFALTVTETVGGGLLALPAAVAGIGPIPGILLILLFGMINISTIYAYSEANIRNGWMRYGNSSLIRVVKDYLGPDGTRLVSVGSFLLSFMVTWGYYIGFAKTLSGMVPIPAAALVIVLFLIGIFLLTRKALNAAVSFALIIGFINLALLLTIIVLSLARFDPTHLTYIYIPTLSNLLQEKTILASIFGVILMSYFGHLSVSTCTRMVLDTQPDGRSLQWGGMLGQAVAMVFNVLWVLAVYGALSRTTILADATGTVLAPLAGEVGVIVKVFGSIFVTLGMGMGAVQSPLNLAFITRGFLPKRSRPTLTLPRRRGQLILRSRKKDPSQMEMVITYLGLRGSLPLLRMELRSEDPRKARKGEHHEFTIDQRWAPESTDGKVTRLEIETIQASPANFNFRLDTDLLVRYQGEWDTSVLSLANILDLEGAQQRLVNWMIRKREFRETEMNLYLGISDAEGTESLRLLVDEDWVEKQELGGVVSYRVNFSPKRPRQLPASVWRSLQGSESPEEKATQNRAPKIWKKFFASSFASLFVTLFPSFLILILSIWSLSNQSITFSDVFGVAGILVGALMTGVIPVLLIAISRKKGERVPGWVYRFMGNPIFLGFIFIISWLTILLHGTIIWEGIVQRALALLVFFWIGFMTFRLIKGGAFRERLVIELCQDLRPSGGVLLSVVQGGKPAIAKITVVTPAQTEEHCCDHLVLPDLLSPLQLQIHIPSSAATELEIWAYQVNGDGETEAIKGVVIARDAEGTRELDLAQTEQKLLLPLKKECRVEISPA